jgi:hypothetical protein
MKRFHVSHAIMRRRNGASAPRRRLSAEIFGAAKLVILAERAQG